MKYMVQMDGSKFIFSLLITVALCLVLGSTFIPSEIVDNYFQLFPVAYAAGVAATVACVLQIVNRKTIMSFSISDIVVLLLLGYYLFIYDYQEQLANWKIIYAVQLAVFWFASRIILSCYPISYKIIVYGIALLGCVQAVWGILQLYGFSRSYHNIYAITGSFYNPGPYTGYIAFIFPICLQQLLTARKAEIYVWAIISALLFCMIPAGLSRSAWGALIVSSLFVLAVHFHWLDKMKTYAKLHFKQTACYATLCLIVVATSIVLLFMMKSGSACGRLFIWKNTLTAVAKEPLFGYGPGSFPAVYGQEQSAYFAQGNYAEWEEQVAGSPEYAFNEYLQVLVEGGGILLLLYCAFIFFTFREGYRKGHYGLCGGLLSFYIFSFSAYPLQVLPFGVVVVLLSSMCVSSYEKMEQRNAFKQVGVGIVGILLLIASSFSIYRLKDTDAYIEKIVHAHSLYSNGAYQDAFSTYHLVYDKIDHNPKLLLRFARMLAKQGQHQDAILVLERAQKVCCDVAILNASAFYYKHIGEYEQAEKFFKKSINQLPIRIYPYYMLAKLYADSAYYDRKKMEEMITIVINKEPKVHSKAVDAMKEEIRKLSIKSNYLLTPKN